MGRSTRADRSDTRKETRTAKARILDPSLEALDALDVDAVVIGLSTDCRPLRGATGFIDWRLCGQLSALIQSGSITGAAGERVLTSAHHGLRARRLFIFGWGPGGKLTDGAALRMATIVRTLDEAKVDNCVVALPWPTTPLLSMVDDCLQGPLGERLLGVFGPDPM